MGEPVVGGGPIWLLPTRAARKPAVTRAIGAATYRRNNRRFDNPFPKRGRMMPIAALVPLEHPYLHEAHSLVNAQSAAGISSGALDDLLSQYAAGRLAPALRALVAGHLSLCEDN